MMNRFIISPAYFFLLVTSLLIACTDKHAFSVPSGDSGNPEPDGSASQINEIQNVPALGPKGQELQTISDLDKLCLSEFYFPIATTVEARSAEEDSTLWDIDLLRRTFVVPSFENRAHLSPSLINAAISCESREATLLFWSFLTSDTLDYARSETYFYESAQMFGLLESTKPEFRKWYFNFLLGFEPFYATSEHTSRLDEDLFTHPVTKLPEFIISRSRSFADDDFAKNLVEFYFKFQRSEKLSKNLALQSQIQSINKELQEYFFASVLHGEVKVVNRLLDTGLVELQEFAGYSDRYSESKDAASILHDRNRRKFNVSGLNALMIASISDLANKSEMIKLLIDRGIDVEATAKGPHLGKKYQDLDLHYWSWARNSGSSSGSSGSSSIGGSGSSSGSGYSSGGSSGKGSDSSSAVSANSVTDAGSAYIWAEHYLGRMDSALRKKIYYNDCTGCTALMIAIQRSEEKIVRILVKGAKVDLNKKSDGKISPLDFSIELGASHDTMSSLLVNLGAKISKSQYQKMAEIGQTRTAADYVIKLNFIENHKFVSDFLAGPKMSADGFRDHAANDYAINGAVSYAIEKICTSKSSSFFNLARREKTADQVSETLLMKAVRNNRYHTAESILSCPGVDVNVIIEGKSALDLASNEAIKELLINKGGKPGWRLKFGL